MKIKQSVFLVFSLSLFLVLSEFVAGAQSFSKKPAQGVPLPDMIFIDAYGDTITTKSLKGHTVLITFNRYVSCPLCNFRTHELMQAYDSLKEKGFILLSVYESGRELLTEYTSNEKVPFVMIPDPDLSLYKLFRVEKSWWKGFKGLFNNYNKKHAPGKKLFKGSYERDGSLNRIGADFLIDEDGIIQTAYYGKFVGDHYPVDAIVEWVNR